MMSSPGGGPIAGWKRRLLTEPAVHFFALGALLFLAHRLFVGTPRTVVVTPGVKADLSRRYQDANGRPPSDAELAAEVQKWKIDEALFREAVRERLDRDDPGIRAILADKMRMRAAFELPKREPTDAELDAWLAAHREPLRNAAALRLRVRRVSEDAIRARGGSSTTSSARSSRGRTQPPSGGPSSAAT